MCLRHSVICGLPGSTIIFHYLTKGIFFLGGGGNFIHSFHWQLQNSKIPCRSQELLPFLSLMYFILPPFSTNCSSILSRLILPSISWSTSRLVVRNSYITLFWEFYFHPFSVYVQTNVIYLTLSPLLQ